MKKIRRVISMSLFLALSTSVYSYAGVVSGSSAKVVSESSVQENAAEGNTVNTTQESTTQTNAAQASTTQQTTGTNELVPAEETAVNETTVGPGVKKAGDNASTDNSTGSIRRDSANNYGPGMNLPKSNNTNSSEVTIPEDSKYYPYVWRESGQQPDAKAYVFQPSNFNGKTVFLDAGHGDNASQVVYQKNEKIYPLTDEELSAAGNWSKGYGVGAQARTTPNVYDNKEIEPEFTLDVALQTKDILLSRGYKVVMSRTSADQNISNGSRAVLAGQTSDIMISIHSNASSSKKANGSIAFYPGDNDYLSTRDYTGYTNLMGLGANQEASKKLSTKLVNNLSSQVGFKNLGTAQAVLRIFTYSSIPTSLVEVGFSDNATDAKLLIEKKPEISKALADGVDEYFR